MGKTPCEKLGYKVGDKFVVIRASEESGARVGDFLKLSRDDGSLNPIFLEVGSDIMRWPHLDNVEKIDADGWIEWKGGDMPVERGTLVDVMFRGDGEVYSGKRPTAYRWSHKSNSCDIVAYRLHQEEKPEIEQAAPTLDELLHAWQKAKANADTSRNTLKLAEQEESAARKALDDVLRSAGWGDAQHDESLNITDWRDLKPGDIVWWSGDIEFIPNEYSVAFVVHDYKGACAFRVRDENGRSEWVNTVEQQWRFIRRPA